MRWLVCGLAGWALVACGGGAEEEPVESTSAGPLMADETTGDEALPEPEPDPEPEAAAPTYGELTQVTVMLQVGSDEGAGTFTITDLEGATVAEGRSGDAVNLRTGPYTVTASVTDEDLLIDTPTREEEVSVGDMTPMVIVRFPRAQVRLNIRQGGRLVRRATVTLTRSGGDEPVARVRNVRGMFPISPGRYDALIDLGRLEVPVSDLIFQEDARQEVPVNIN